MIIYTAQSFDIFYSGLLYLFYLPIRLALIISITYNINKS
nr:MAG TPA: hypothetical protein [Caudoviricetes sp.]